MLPFSCSIFKWCQVLVFARPRCRRYIFPRVEIRDVKVPLDSWPRRSNILGPTVVSCPPFVHQRCLGHLVARWAESSAFQLEPCPPCSSERYQSNISPPSLSDQVRSILHSFVLMFLHRLHCPYPTTRHL